MHFQFLSNHLFKIDDFNFENLIVHRQTLHFLFTLKTDEDLVEKKLEVGFVTPNKVCQRTVCRRTDGPKDVSRREEVSGAGGYPPWLSKIKSLF